MATDIVVRYIFLTTWPKRFLEARLVIVLFHKCLALDLASHITKEEMTEKIGATEGSWGCVPLACVYKIQYNLIYKVKPDLL